MFAVGALNEAITIPVGRYQPQVSNPAVALAKNSEDIKRTSGEGLFPSIRVVSGKSENIARPHLEGAHLIL